MRRREFLLSLSLTVLAQQARAQPASRQVFRVGVLTPQSQSEPPTLQRIPLERGLRDLGWNPGTDILIEYRYAQGSVERLERDAADLVAQNVDLLITRGSAATLAAQRATGVKPIVMAAVADPIGEGFAASLHRPGANITGLASTEAPLEGKRLELLKDAFPTIKRVAILSRSPSIRDFVGGALGITVSVFEAPDPSAIAPAFAAMSEAHVDASLVLQDPHVFEPHRHDVIAQENRLRLPAIYPWRLYPEAGGLMSFGSSISGWHYRSASYIDRILKGAKPSDLPIEQPTTHEAQCKDSPRTRDRVPVCAPAPRRRGDRMRRREGRSVGGRET